MNINVPLRASLPVGANLFGAARLTNLGVDRISIAVISLVLIYAMEIVLISAYPRPVTWLPTVFYSWSAASRLKGILMMPADHGRTRYSHLAPHNI